MASIELVVLIETQPGKRNCQIEAFNALKPLVLAEDGCLRYDLRADKQHENRFLLFERWASQSALDAHNNAEHMRAAGENSPAFRAKPAMIIELVEVEA